MTSWVDYQTTHGMPLAPTPSALTSASISNLLLILKLRLTLRFVCKGDKAYQVHFERLRRLSLGFPLRVHILTYE